MMTKSSEIIDLGNTELWHEYLTMLLARIPL